MAPRRPPRRSCSGLREDSEPSGGGAVTRPWSPLPHSCSSLVLVPWLPWRSDLLGPSHNALPGQHQQRRLQLACGTAGVGVPRRGRLLSGRTNRPNVGPFGLSTPSRVPAGASAAARRSADSWMRIRSDPAPLLSYTARGEWAGPTARDLRGSPRRSGSAGQTPSKINLNRDQHVRISMLIMVHLDLEGDSAGKLPPRVRLPSATLVGDRAGAGRLTSSARKGRC